MFYNRINFNPNIWGPKAWFFLDTIILSYPENPTHSDIILFKDFFVNVGNILPCEKCRFNFEDHIIKFPLNNDILKSKNKLISWWINIHNETRQGKKLFTYNDFIDYYNCIYSNNETKDNNQDVKNINQDSNNQNIKENNLFKNIMLLILLIIVFLYLKKKTFI